MFFAKFAITVILLATCVQVIATIVYVKYHNSKQNYQNHEDDIRKIRVRNFEFGRWRGGVRYPLGLTKEKEVFYQIEKKIKYP